MLTIDISFINRAGLGDDVISRYCLSGNVTSMMRDILAGEALPPILVYKPINGIYTIADGIHRFSAYMKLGYKQININIL